MMELTKRALKGYERAVKEYEQAVKEAAKREAEAKNKQCLPYKYSNLVEFSEKVRFLAKGVPFSFKDREYLKPIYKDNSKEINIVKGRQTEITEFLLNWLLYNLITHPGTIGLYMSDRQDHVSVFSTLRLRNRALGLSSELQKFVPRGKHKKSEQHFNNGSVLYMYSGWADFEAARSIPADFAALDEMQSMNIEALPVVKESMAHSRFGRIVKVGTGSNEGDAWWKEWNDGTQMRWDEHEKTWVHKDPSKPIVTGITSYQISQKIVPIVRDTYEYKKAKYPPQNFTMEVDGWFYKGMRKPLLTADIQALMDRNLDFTTAVNVNHDLGPVYMGVDWGGGVQAYTVAWIWQLIDQTAPRFKLLYVKKYDQEEDRSTEVQADKVSKLIDIYEVDRVVMDAGGGARQVEKLSNRYAERVYKCTYTPRPEFPFEPINSERRINVDRCRVSQLMST